jgi:PAS domain S-box-containing protein
VFEGVAGMPKSDSLKNRLDELFSTIAVPSEEETAPSLAEQAQREIVPEAPVLEAPVAPEPVAPTQIEQLAFTEAETEAEALPKIPVQPAIPISAGAFEIAFESNPVGMVMTSLDGRFLQVNDAFCQLLGYSRQELEGRSFQSLTYPEDETVGREAISMMLKGDSQTARMQQRYTCKDGQLVWADLNVTLSRDQTGQPQFIITTIRDVTPQRDTSALLEKRVRELNCLNDIGHKLDEKPPLPEFFTWITRRIPAAFRDPEHCSAAVEYQGQIYGYPDVLDLKSKVVGGLRVDGELVGWLHVAYREPATTQDFIDAESALLGSIVSRVSSYIESQHLLEQTQASLERAQKSQQLLSTVVDTIPNPVYFKDAQGIYTGCNQAYLDYLGLTADQVIGNSVHQLKIDHERVNQFYTSDMELFQHPGVQSYEATVRYPDGSFHQVVNNKATFNNPDGSLGGLVGVVVDVTGQQGAQVEMRRQAEELAKVADIATKVSTTLDPEQLLQNVVDLTKTDFGLYHAHIYLINAEGDTLELAAGAGEVGRQMVKQGRNIALDSERSLVARAARQHVGVIANDVQADPDFLPNPLLPDTASEMAIPLIVGDRCLGVLDVQSEHVGHFTSSDVAIQTTLGSQVAVALQNARQYEQARQSEQLIRTLVDNLPDYIFIKDRKSRWILNNKAHLSLLGFESQEEVLGKSDLDIFPIEFAQKYFDDEQELIRKREPLIGYEETVIHQTTGQKLYITTSKIPILDDRGDVVAMVGINHDITDLKRVEEQLAHQAQQMAVVAKISTTIASVLNPDELLQEIVDLTTENFGLYHAHIYLLDETGRNLNLVAGAFDVGRKMVAQGWKIALGSEQSLIARAAREHKGIIVGDVRSDPHFLPNELLPDTRAEMAVPMLVGDRLLGVLDLQSEQVDHFVQQDADIMTSLAAQATVAIQNARQYQATEASERLVRTLIDNLPDYIFVKDTQSRFILNNRAHLGQLGFKSQEQALGKSDLDIFEPELAQKYYNDEQELMREKRPLIGTMESSFHKTTGKKLTFETSKIPILDERGNVTALVGIAHDVTEREALLAETGRQAQTLTVLNEMSRALTITLDIDTVLHTIYVYTTRLMEADNFFIAQYDATSNQLSYPLVMNDNQPLTLESHTPGNGLTEYIIRTQKPLLLSKFDPSQIAALGIEAVIFGDDKPVLSWLGVPMLFGELVLGAIVVQSDATPGLYTERQRDLLMAVASQAANALTLAQQYQQTQSSLASTQALYAGSAQVARARSLQEVLDALVQSTFLAQMDRAVISFFDQPWETHPPETTTTAVLWEKDGVPREAIGSVYSMQSFPALQLLDRNRPTIIPHVTTDERLDERSRDLLNRMGRKGVATFPLLAGGEWFGLLTGQSAEPLTVTDEQVRRLSSLTDQAATVIQSLRLQESMRERVQELTSLQRMMSREAWVAYQSQMALSNQGYLFDRINLLPVNQEALSVVLPELVPMVSNGVSVSSLSGDQLVTEAAQPAPLAIPLEVRGEAIGLLGVRGQPSMSLSEEDEAFLEAISEQVAQALERARLAEQTQKSAVELQAVAEVGTATATILEPQELLQQVVDLAKTRFGLYHAHVYLLDEYGKNLMLTVGAGDIGRSMAAEGWSIALSERDSLVARVARDRQGEFITDVTRQTDYLPNPSLPDTRSELAVPMVIADQLLGVFDVQSNLPGRFAMEDVRTYATLASQIAVALQNARLYAEQLVTVERLRELDNMKSAFLANMSHELRTPLNSILGFTQVIMEGLDGPLTDLMSSDLELIEKNGKHLLHLINDVLDMAKIEAGRLTLSPEPINLYELLDEVIITNSSLARDKSLYMTLDADPIEDWVVMADHVRIRQVLINLVGNSIKFTEAGGITVQLERFLPQTELEAERIQVRVIDTGIGIPANKIEEVFEAFSQVDSSTTRKAGGTGLGLPISRRLVEIHGGRLWAESEGQGKGSTFFLELPVGRISTSVVE